MSIRFWLHLLRPTPRTPEPDSIQHLGDPDEIPEPDTAPDGRASVSPPAEPAPEPAPGPVRPLGEPDETPDPVTLRLLHEGLQAWEPPQSEPEPEPPLRRDSSCIDQPGRRCDSGDALTSLITAFKALERRVEALESKHGDQS